MMQVILYNKQMMEVILLLVVQIHLVRETMIIG